MEESGVILLPAYKKCGFTYKLGLLCWVFWLQLHFVTPYE